MFNKIIYSIQNATILDVKPVYQATAINSFEIGLDVTQLRCPTGFVNLSGLTWCDRKYKLVKDIFLNEGLFIVTDSDIIGHDCYVDNLDKKRIIVMYFSDLDTSPSRKRIKKSYDKLKELGFKVKYCASKSSAEKYCQKLINKAV